MANDIHHWVEERLSAYLDNQIASAEQARVDAHLRECDRCRASLESLRWTVSLLKHTPVPAPSRQFTLPVPRSKARAARPSFAFLRAATVLATILLCTVVSYDLFGITRFSAAPEPAQFAAPVAAPTNIALAPTSAPAATVATPITRTNLAPAPPGAPAATSAPTVAVAAPKPTSAPPQAASQPAALPTATRVVSVGAAEAQPTASAADQSLKSSATVAAPLLAPRAAITATATIVLPSPTRTSAPSATATIVPPTSVPSATATIVPPTATTRIQARAEPTRTRDEIARNSQPVAPPLRLIELGLGALVIGLGVLTIFAWRRK